MTTATVEGFSEDTGSNSERISISEKQTSKLADAYGSILTAKVDSPSQTNFRLRNINSLVKASTEDNWSKVGVSSAVSINVASGNCTAYDIHDDTQSQKKKWCFKISAWLHKLLGNILLPGLFGIDNCRYVQKLHWKSPISQELIANTIYFCSRIHAFVKHDLIPEAKGLATQMYFPTGQIEADGLSVISADIWAATYLLLGAHKKIREADFHNIRGCYTNLVWESGKAYRATEDFYRCLQAFRTKVFPLWSEIEKLAGVPKDDFADIDAPPQFINLKNVDKSVPVPLAKVRIRNDLVLQNTLTLVVTPEKKSSKEDTSQEAQFSELSYGQQVQIVQALLSKPVSTLESGANVLLSAKEKLDNEKICGNCNPDYFDKDLTCTKAMRILIATLQILFEEVDLPVGLRLDVVEWFRCVTDEINSYFNYAEWIASKFSEFHSMLGLSYNFALLCFDLDLPSFDGIIRKEQESDTLYQTSTSCPDDRFAYKAVSLTKLMSDAEISRRPLVDEDFDWQDFYKTDYHDVLQRIPLRIGQNLLQFRARPDVKVMIRERFEIVFPIDAKTEEYRYMDNKNTIFLS